MGDLTHFPMWRPTKLQWLVIWLTTVLCLIAFLATDPEPSMLIPPAMLVAGLFLWQATQKEEV